MTKKHLDDVLEARGEQYGPFIDHATIAQDLKDVVRDALEENVILLEPDQQEALEMILHKIARIVNGNPDNIDSWIDIAGYSTLVANRLRDDEQASMRELSEVLA